ncbi:MAG: bifunctional phosphoglucose/phosphomannose isomerase [Patescibacteria group bacterium]|nr:bifunctional phosphoglucose/phosphomannose isomerase [Patescibacteria group bacterium]
MRNSSDPSNMWQMIADYPAQFGKGFDLSVPVNIKRPITKAILAGMGGSALAGDLINCAFAEELKYPITLSRDYVIRESLDSEVLVIVNSFSGNTAETLSAYTQAVQAGAQVIAIASGGELIRRAVKDGVEYIILKKESKDFQPRMSTGYIFAILTALLIKAQWLNFSAEKQVRQMAQALSQAKTEVLGKQLGESLVGTIPLFYTSDDFWPVARIGKIKFNENAKIPAFWNVFPELNHNEMVGFSQTRDNYRIVILKDPDTHPAIARAMLATAHLLRERPIGLKATIWDMPAGNKLYKIFATLMLLDWASYYLAMQLNIDPTPVKLVEDFKSAIK